MKNIRTIGVYLLTVTAVAVFMAGGQASAQEANEPNEQTKTETKKYEYVAQEGDSYTQIARKAVQTYGINNKKSIGKARIVAAETKLTEAAGWPILEIGQKVTIEESAVSQVVEDVMKLSEQDVAAWQTYVPFINFSTNSVGEAQK